MPKKGQKISKELSLAIAEANRRRIWTPEMLENMSKAHLGKPVSDEAKKKISDALLGNKNPFFGKTHSEETRRKISEANKGKPGYNLGKHLSVETKEKLRQAHLGKKLSDAHKRAISRAGKGKPKPSDFGEKISKALRNSPIFQGMMRGKPGTFTGRTHSEESKKKMSISSMGQPAWNKGRPHPEETRAKMKKKAQSRPPVSDIAKKKMSAAHSGSKNHFYGKTHSAETKAKMTGPNNSQWKGGHERYYGPEWTDTLKAKIRKRDGYQCFLDPAHPISGYFKVPDVHHIIPYFDAVDAQLDRPHRHENLVSLCRKCHGWADSNLDISIPKLQSLLAERYNYNPQNMLPMPIHTQK